MSIWLLQKPTLTLPQARTLLYSYFEAQALFSETDTRSATMRMGYSTTRNASVSSTESRALANVGMLEQWEPIREALLRLNEQQQQWLTERYGLCKTVAEGAQEMGLTMIAARTLDTVAVSCLVVAMGKMVLPRPV